MKYSSKHLFRVISLAAIISAVATLACGQTVNIDRVVAELEPEIQRALLAGNIPSASIATTASSADSTINRVRSSAFRHASSACFNSSMSVEVLTNLTTSPLSSRRGTPRVKCQRWVPSRARRRRISIAKACPERRPCQKIFEAAARSSECTASSQASGEDRRNSRVRPVYSDH